MDIDVYTKIFEKFWGKSARDLWVTIRRANDLDVPAWNKVVALLAIADVVRPDWICKAILINPIERDAVCVWEKQGELTISHFTSDDELKIRDLSLSARANEQPFALDILRKRGISTLRTLFEVSE